MTFLRELFRAVGCLLAAVALTLILYCLLGGV